MPKKKITKKIVKKHAKRRIVHKALPQSLMTVDDKSKMNEMLKVMLAKSPMPGVGTNIFGTGTGTITERKLTEAINDVHKLQLQYNKGKEELERWTREKQDLNKQIADLKQQKKDAQIQISDQNEKQKLMSQKADVSRLKAKAAGEHLNVQLKGQLDKEQQALKNTELSIQLVKQDINKNNTFAELQRLKEQNKSKGLELQALRQTLVSDEFNYPDKALMDEYRKAQQQDMELKHREEVIKLVVDNNVRRARLEAMEKVNQDFNTNKKVPKRDAFGNVIYIHQAGREFNDGHRYDLDYMTDGKGTEASNVIIFNGKPVKKLGIHLFKDVNMQPVPALWEDIPNSSPVAMYQKERIEKELENKDLKEKLLRAENERNKYIQIQHEVENLDEQKKYLQTQINITNNNKEAIAKSTDEMLKHVKPVLEEKARLQAQKELADQTLVKTKENAVAQMNLAAELEKSRQIQENKFSSPIKKIAQAEVEAEQKRQQTEAIKHTNQALEEHNKLQAIDQIRSENVEQGTDNPEVYANIMNTWNERRRTEYAKEELLRAAKNDYARARGDHEDYLSSHAVTSQDRSRYMTNIFNLDLDNATVDEIRNRLSLVNEIAVQAPRSGDTDVLADWINRSIDFVQGNGR